MFIKVTVIYEFCHSFCMILASASPRRKEILENAGFHFTVISKNISEKSTKKEIHTKIMDIADQKCMAVAQEFPDEYVLGADCAVVLGTEIIGKPKNKEDAFSILRRLSGKPHTVITAYSLRNIKKKFHIQNFEKTKVYFKKLSDADINWYISTGEPMDKAGAYAAQGKSAMFIEKIDGDFFTVMGFPLALFIEDLKKTGLTLQEILSL